MFEQPLVLDASTLLNLLATGEAETILRCVPVARLVCTIAASAVLHLRNEDTAKPPDPVSVKPLIDAGVLTSASLQTSEEELLFVQLAASLEDGEAMSLALCVSRNYALATDDRKAQTIATAQSVPLIASSHLVLNWKKEAGIDRDKVRSALRLIGTRARFRPWRGYPEQNWWDDMVSGTCGLKQHNLAGTAVRP